MVPSSSSKKDLGVVSSLVMAEKEQDSFFRRDSLFLRMHCFSSCQGLLRVSAYF